MKFSEKYDLLESLTTGAVETFVANDKVRGERVLVHIVECAPQKPDQTTAEWVLESFRRLAPEPPGPVLETGKYSGAKYAYVVTKPADENVVKAWVRRYELQAEETKETKVHALKRETSGPPLAPPITPKEPPQAPPGQMTQLFRDFDSLAKSKAPEPFIPSTAPPATTCSLNQSAGRVWAACGRSLGSLQHEGGCAAEGTAIHHSSSSDSSRSLRSRRIPSLETMRNRANLPASSKAHSEETGPRTCQLTHHSQSNLRKRTLESLRLCSAAQHLSRQHRQRHLAPRGRVLPGCLRTWRLHTTPPHRRRAASCHRRSALTYCIPNERHSGAGSGFRRLAAGNSGSTANLPTPDDSSVPAAVYGRRRYRRIHAPQGRSDAGPHRSAKWTKSLHADHLALKTRGRRRCRSRARACCGSRWGKVCCALNAQIWGCASADAEDSSSSSHAQSEGAPGAKGSQNRRPCSAARVTLAINHHTDGAFLSGGDTGAVLCSYDTSSCWLDTWSLAMGNDKISDQLD